MLVRSGILLIKCWFSVSDEEQGRRFQGRRFQGRLKNPTKRWKLSPMDLESRKPWVEYSKAKHEGLEVAENGEICAALDRIEGLDYFNVIAGSMAGRIIPPQLAEQVLKAGQADLIGMTRSLITDPEMPNRRRQARF